MLKDNPSVPEYIQPLRRRSPPAPLTQGSLCYRQAVQQQRQSRCLSRLSPRSALNACHRQAAPFTQGRQRHLRRGGKGVYTGMLFCVIFRNFIAQIIDTVELFLFFMDSVKGVFAFLSEQCGSLCTGVFAGKIQFNIFFRFAVVKSCVIQRHNHTYIFKIGIIIGRAFTVFFIFIN